MVIEFISISKHAYYLMKVIHAIEFEGVSQIDFHNITDWLNMAAGVEEVKVITEKYDSSIYMCDSALYYSNEKSKLWSKLCTVLVTFNFIWGSSESLILKFVTKTGKDSTTYLGRKFINENYTNTLIEGYLQTYNTLQYLLQKEMKNKGMEDVIKEPQTTKGLYLVSKLRNQFAHGSRFLPEPDDWSVDINNEIEIIQLSSRIVMFTMQMLLLSQYGLRGQIIENPSLFNFEQLDESISLDSLIKNLHFDDYNTIFKRLELF